MATSAFTGEELAPHQVVLAGRLYGNTRGANGQSNAYYENLKRINISENEFKARIQRGEDADAVLADVPLARAHDASKALDKKISDLRKYRRAIDQALQLRQAFRRECTAQLSFGPMVAQQPEQTLYKACDCSRHLTNSPRRRRPRNCRLCRS